jgi:hypothetical protein
VGDLDAILAEGDQPGGGQCLEYLLHLGAVLPGGQFGALGAAAGVLGALPQRGQPQEDVPGDHLLGSGKGPVDRLSGPRDGLAHPSGVPVPGARQGPASTAFPGGRQGVRQQRPGFLPQIRQHGFDQAGLQHQASALCRAGDRLPQLPDSHRGDQQLAVLQRGGQRRVVTAPGVEIRADPQHHGGPTLGIGSQGREGSKEALPLGVRSAEGEDLLHLINDHQQPGPGWGIGEDLADGQAQALRVGMQIGE